MFIQAPTQQRHGEQSDSKKQDVSSNIGKFEPNKENWQQDEADEEENAMFKKICPFGESELTVK